MNKEDEVFRCALIIILGIGVLVLMCGFYRMDKHLERIEIAVVRHGITLPPEK